jgi:hypothetical protein
LAISKPSRAPAPQARRSTGKKTSGAGRLPVSNASIWPEKKSASSVSAPAIWKKDYKDRDFLP